MLDRITVPSLIDLQGISRPRHSTAAGCACATTCLLLFSVFCPSRPWHRPHRVAFPRLPLDPLRQRPFSPSLLTALCGCTMPTAPSSGGAVARSRKNRVRKRERDQVPEKAAGPATGRVEPCPTSASYGSSRSQPSSQGAACSVSFSFARGVCRWVSSPRHQQPGNNLHQPLANPL
jgi:hypothetical protein